MKKVIYIAACLIVIIGLGCFYKSWYSYEKRTDVQQEAPKTQESNTSASHENIYVESFDPNQSTSMKSTDVLQGSYPIEGDRGDRYAWVREDSKIYLKNINGKSIVVRGYIPFTYHQKASKVGEITIDFLVDGQSVQRLTVKEDKVFEQIIPFNLFSNLIKDNQCELDIHVSNEYIPANAGLSTDERELSMMVKYIGVK
jgi:hypothetical protein